MVVWKFNIFVLVFDYLFECLDYSWCGVWVGKVIGGEEIGVCLYEFVVGEWMYLYYFYYGNEEWVFVVVGMLIVCMSVGE